MAITNIFCAWQAVDAVAMRIIFYLCWIIEVFFQITTIAQEESAIAYIIAFIESNCVKVVGALVGKKSVASANDDFFSYCLS